MAISLEEFMQIKSIKVTCSDEKETQFGITDEGMYLYTTDSKYMHKAQKTISKCPSMVVSINETHNRDGETTSIDIDLDPRYTNPSLFKIKRNQF